MNGESGKAGPSARLQLAQGQEYRRLEDIVTTPSLDTEGDPAHGPQLRGIDTSAVVQAHFLCRLFHNRTVLLDQAKRYLDTVKLTVFVYFSN